MPDPEPRETKINQRTLSWREQGDGPPVVLIHGIGGSSESWGGIFDDLSQRYRVLAWDAPGYGVSDLLDGSATAETYADGLAALLRERDVTEAHMVAHSIGAPIAGALCASAALTVQSLTLLHPVTGFGGMAPPRRAELRAARLADIEGMTMAAFGKVRAPRIMGRAANQIAVDEAARIIGTIPEAAYRAMVDVMAAADLMAYLPRLRVPVLVIAGEDDAIAPPAACQEIADATGDASCETRPGTGHYLPLEDPGFLLARLTRFWSAHVPG